MILVVDDNELVRDLIQVTLTESGYTVDCTGSGEEALEVIKEKKPELLIVDYILPGMNGHEVCNKVKGNPLYSSIPIILISAANKPGQQSEGYHSGAIDYLKKPIDNNLLLAKVRSLLDIQTAQKKKSEMGKVQTAQDIVATMAHKINNPLTAILGNVELELRINKDADDSTTRRLKQIHENALKIRDIISSFSMMKRVVQTEYLGETTMIDIEKSLSD